MADNLATSIQDLRSASSQLNAITDEAARTVLKVEDFLNNECSVGIPAAVEISSETDDVHGNTHSTYLEYRRVGQRFRIAIVHFDDLPETESVKAWSDSPRDEKLDAFKKLPDLIIKIAVKLQERISEVQESVDTVNVTVTALGERKGG